MAATGNFHYCLAVDTANPQEIREAKAFAGIMLTRANPKSRHVKDGICILHCKADMCVASSLCGCAPPTPDRLAARAIRMGGTCSGEHGVGYGKLKHLQMEHGDAALRVMHSIKMVSANDFVF